MGTEVLQSFDNLQDELERAKSNLKGLNENIRRIIGREPPSDINSRLNSFIIFLIPITINNINKSVFLILF